MKIFKGYKDLKYTKNSAVSHSHSLQSFLKTSTTTVLKKLTKINSVFRGLTSISNKMENKATYQKL